MATLCSRSRHARAPLAASHITEHSQDQKCLIFPEGGKPDGLENPCGTAENSTHIYGPDRESNRVTLVRGECFTHKPTMPPKFIHILKPGTTTKVNLITVLNQEPNREKTRKEVLVLDVGGKPPKIIPGKTHAVR